jgi:hypothetical protein
MQNWAIEKRVKKTGGKMIYRVRIEPKNKKAPHLAGLCCAKLFFNEQLRLVGGADGTRTRDPLRDRQVF